MAKAFCLTKDFVEKFKKGLISGEISPEKIANLSSDERHAYLADFVGESNAKEVNALFESKLLLKNQKQGMITWAKNVMGMKEPARKDLISRIEKLDRVLSPAEGEQFLKDLAATKLGFGVTQEEAQKIMELSKKVTETSKVGGREYGNAYLDMQEYVDSLKPSKKEDIVNAVGGFQKALTATLDLSAPLRQGRALFGSREWFGAIKRMFSYAVNDGALRNLNADIVSHKDFQLAKKSGLAMSSLGGEISKSEEQFMSKFVNKLPLIKGSERAYVGFLTDLRFNRFTNLLNQAEKAGLDIRSNPEMINNLARVINSSTGRGSFRDPLLDASLGKLSRFFFSPRFVKSRFDNIDPVYYMKLDPFSRKQALKTTINLAASTGTIMAMASAAGAQVEWDARSSNFGKMKIGNKWIDVTGGFNGPIRLIAQILSRSTKSSDTGVITPLNSDKFGARTGGDVLISFFEGKESPIVSTINTLYGGKDFGGKDVKTASERAAFITGQFLPLIVKDMASLYADGGIKNVFEAGIPSLFGVNVKVSSPRIDRAISEDPSFLQNVLGLENKADPKFRPLLDRFSKNRITLSVPTTAVQIKPSGEKKSRDLNEEELAKYQDIYKKNLREALSSRKDYLIGLPDEKLAKEVDSLKLKVTEKSKKELLK